MMMSVAGHSIASYVQFRALAELLIRKGVVTREELEQEFSLLPLAEAARAAFPVRDLDEDEARRLADELRDEAPEGARVHVEPGGRVAWEVAPENPFAIFGGFGG
jgi:hypothetical protein